MPLDDKDAKLLRLLQDDCRLSNAELAERLHISPSACYRRVKSLEDAGVITGYGARVNAGKAGLGFQVIVHIQLTRHGQDHMRQFIEAIGRWDEVLDCYGTSGQADYHLRVLVKDIDAYNRFLEQKLFTLPAVQSAQTNIVLRVAKQHTALPVAASETQS